jgi:gp16 family phage-associated protein
MVGDVLLRDWLAREGQTVAGFARRIGIDRSAVHRWLAGTRRPTVGAALRIEDATRGEVPVSIWAGRDVARRARPIR